MEEVNEELSQAVIDHEVEIDQLEKAVIYYQSHLFAVDDEQDEAFEESKGVDDVDANSKL